MHRNSSVYKCVGPCSPPPQAGCSTLCLCRKFSPVPLRSVPPFHPRPQATPHLICLLQLSLVCLYTWILKCFHSSLHLNILGIIIFKKKVWHLYLRSTTPLAYDWTVPLLEMKTSSAQRLGAHLHCSFICKNPKLQTGLTSISG